MRRTREYSGCIGAPGPAGDIRNRDLPRFASSVNRFITKNVRPCSFRIENVLSVSRLESAPPESEEALQTREHRGRWYSLINAIAVVPPNNSSLLCESRSASPDGVSTTVASCRCSRGRGIFRVSASTNKRHDHELHNGEDTLKIASICALATVHFRPLHDRGALKPSA